jgi:hypothetical protein
VPVATLVAASGAAAAWRSGLTDECDYLIKPGYRVQGIKHLPALRLIQRRQFCKPALETRRFHDRLLTLWTGVGALDCSSVQASLYLTLTAPPKKPGRKEKWLRISSEPFS